MNRNDEMISEKQLNDLGITRIAGQKFVVQTTDKDEIISGTNGKNEPIELKSNTVVYIPPNENRKVYIGNNKEVLKMNLKEKNPQLFITKKEKVK
jgi:hypothetical protein